MVVFESFDYVENLTHGHGSGQAKQLLLSLNCYCQVIYFFVNFKAPKFDFFLLVRWARARFVCQFFGRFLGYGVACFPRRNLGLCLMHSLRLDSLRKTCRTKFGLVAHIQLNYIENGGGGGPVIFYDVARFQEIGWTELWDNTDFKRSWTCTSPLFTILLFPGGE